MALHSAVDVDDVVHCNMQIIMNVYFHVHIHINTFTYLHIKLTRLQADHVRNILTN